MSEQTASNHTRKIIHIDMDCFYAAVEVKHRPELKGKPLGVGGPPNSRSVLTTASYEARKFGVRSAMPSSQAVRLCPELILVPPNFDLYKRESRAVREIFEKFTDLIEPLSLDEAYLDMTGAESATRIAKEIRAMIAKEVGLTASAGIAPNKFLAKIASDWKKPNGQFTIQPHEVEAFMPSLPVDRLYGVGQVTAKRMHARGVHVCEDIQKQPLYLLARWFGSRAQELMDLSHGIDHREVHPHAERKSLTVEETFSTDLTQVEECLARLPELYADWEKRMLRLNARDRIRGFVVKLKFHDFKTTTHENSSREWPTPAHFAELLQRAWKRRGEPVRLLGIGVRLASEKSKATDQLTFGI